MRLTCTLALACLLASCAQPPVATVVEDQPTKPAVVRNTTPEPAAIETTPLPGGKRRVMLINPDMTNRLPDRKDMQATAPLQTAADRGPNLIVPAPKPPPSE